MSGRLGLTGKLPAHGDFVQRGLPASFCAPWDAWLEAGIAAAREALGEGFGAAWDAAPAWRFALPAGACGPDAVAGVLVPSADTVGRRWPLAAVATGASPLWPAPWFAALEGAARAGLAAGADADALAALLPPPGPTDPTDAPEPGWWTAGTAAEPGLVWPLPALPDPQDFALLLEPPA